MSFWVDVGPKLISRFRRFTPGSEPSNRAASLANQKFEKHVQI